MTFVDIEFTIMESQSGGDPLRIQSVARALTLLEYVGQSPQGVRLKDAAAEVGLSLSTAHNLLATLQSLEYVAQPVSGGRYVLTTKLAELARRGTEGNEGLRARFRPIIQKLAESTGETSYLAVPAVPDYLYLDGVDSAQPFRLTAPVGTYDRLLGSAIGHTLLAFRPELAQRIAALDPEGWERWRPRIDQARGEGYALDLEEAHPGLCCVAVPVREGSEVVAAIGIAGPSSRLPEDRLRTLAGDAHSAADDVPAPAGAAGS